MVVATLIFSTLVVAQPSPPSSNASGALLSGSQHAAVPVDFVRGEAFPINPFETPLEDPQNTCIDGGSLACPGQDCCFTFRGGGGNQEDCCCPKGAHCLVHSGDGNTCFGPGAHPCQGPPRWPSFATSANLQASPWAAYYTAVYGAVPPAAAFPLVVSNAWFLYSDALNNAKVVNIPAVQKCPHAEYDRYQTNDAYQPINAAWIWHPYPYAAFAAHTKVEVIHEADPFGDEHFGMWMIYARGSGIFFDLGVTISFAEHQDAYTHFGATGNEDLSKKAAAAGFDSIQFLAHVDHVNYQCDTKNTGRAGFDYMGVEVRAPSSTTAAL